VALPTDAAAEVSLVATLGKLADAGRCLRRRRPQRRRRYRQRGGGGYGQRRTRRQRACGCWQSPRAWVGCDGGWSSWARWSRRLIIMVTLGVSVPLRDQFPVW